MTVRFFFAPEGRKIDTVRAKSLRNAKKTFYRRNPQYQCARGEIYWEIDTPGAWLSGSLDGCKGD